MDNETATRYAQPSQRMFGVLVADDEPEVREIVEIALRDAGFAVWPAVDGQNALELFRRNRKFIDAALLDVNMPRLDGPQTLAALHEIAPQLPCCFMSGGLGAHTAESLSRDGALALLSKPFTIAVVIKAVRNLVRAAESRTAATARRRNLVTSQLLQLDVRGTHSFGTAGRSGISNTRDAHGA